MLIRVNTTLVVIGIVVGAAATGWAQVRTESDVLIDGQSISFGQAVSLSGDNALIGEHQAWQGAHQAGAAYIHRYDPGTGTWSKHGTLSPDDAGYRDYFGISVSLSGSNALIGATGDDDRGADAGAAYIFGYDSGTDLWSQQSKLTAADGASSDGFGTSVSLSGTTALIGADKSDHAGSQSGAAYVFGQDAGTGLWTQQAKLTASNAGSYDYFGQSVSLSGNTALVGARGDDDNGSNSGAAYVFGYDAGTGCWSQRAKLTASNGSVGDDFGQAVAVNRNTALVGAPDHYNNPAAGGGAAYVFDYDAGTETWSEQGRLTAYDGMPFDRFGKSVAVDGDTAIVGMQESYKGRNAAYVFRRNGDEWLRAGKLISSSGRDTGYAVAVDNDKALVGSYYDGKVYAYHGLATEAAKSAVPLFIDFTSETHACAYASGMIGTDERQADDGPHQLMPSQSEAFAWLTWETPGGPDDPPMLNDIHVEASAYARAGTDGVGAYLVSSLGLDTWVDGSDVQPFDTEGSASASLTGWLMIGASDQHPVGSSLTLVAQAFDMFDNTNGGDWDRFDWQLNVCSSSNDGMLLLGTLNMDQLTTEFAVEAGEWLWFEWYHAGADANNTMFMTSPGSRITVDIMVVPEPAMCLLAGLGLVGVGRRRRLASTHV